MSNKKIDFPKNITSIRPGLLERIVDLAISEDLGSSGDITSQSLFKDQTKIVSAKIIAKEEGIVCGLDILKYVYSRIDTSVTVEPYKTDGDIVKKGNVISKISGKALSITMGERIALNFLGMLSGISTKVNRLVKLVHGYPVKLLDTRKTMPGLRELQKYAVNVGGGCNHRLGLYDMILIKENHIFAAGGITEAVRAARANFPDKVIEVETETLDQVKEAMGTDADIIMLDNMNNGMVNEALKIINSGKYTEVSGNIDEKRLVELAGSGVDYISMGSLTHTVKPLDISLLIND